MLVPPSLIETLYYAAETAYSKDADHAGIDIESMPSSRRCRTVSSLMLQALEGQGIDDVEIETRGGWEVDEHRYLVVDGKIVADPTWQQFVPDHTALAGLPNVLIGAREFVVNFAGESGVSQANQQLWMPREASLQPERWLSVQERIARAHDSSY